MYKLVQYKYRITISAKMNRALNWGCSGLNVSKKNLVLFLISNSYDELHGKNETECKELIEKGLQEYKDDFEKSKQDQEYYEKKTSENREKSLSSTIDLCVRVTPFVDGYIQEMASRYRYKKNEIFIALLQMSLHVIDVLLSDYIIEKEFTEDHEYSFQKDKTYFLDCIGISSKDFARLSEAVVLQELFSNTSRQIRSFPDYGFYLEELKSTENGREITTYNMQKLSKGKREYKKREKTTAKKR